ncbi:MAG: hypothetical protein IPG96_06555 [Proteobacteria bacterium]|nr:hypothetical protein [Pseudomonadota bacterium]
MSERSGRAVRWSPRLPVAALLVLGSTAPAFAARGREAPQQVLIIARASPPGELVRRLVSELEYLGLVTAVVWRDAKAGTAEAAVDRARGPQRSALTLEVSAARATLLMATAEGRAPPRRQELALRVGEDVAITATQLAEWVRAARAEVSLPPAAPPVEPPAQRGYTLRVAAGPSWSPGGAGASGQLWLAGDWRLAPWLALAGTALVPMLAARLSNAFGQAELYPLVLGLGARLRPWSGARRLRFSGVLGAGLSAVYLKGSTSFAVLRGTSDWVVGGLGYAGVDLALRLSSRASLVLGALTGVVLPRPVVTFAGLDAGSWGRPLLALSLGLELSP